MDICAYFLCLMLKVYYKSNTRVKINILYGEVLICDLWLNYIVVRDTILSMHYALNYILCYFTKLIII